MDGIINFSMKDYTPGRDRVLYLSLLVSTVIHFMMFGGLAFHKNQKTRKHPREIEVNYVKVNPLPERENKPAYKNVKVVKETPPLPKVDILSSKSGASDFIAKEIKDVSKFSKNFQLDRKKMPQIKLLEVENAYSSPVLKSEKITNPQYLSYNESIRQKIKQRAYQYVRHHDFEAGSVYLTFIIKKDGTLQDIKIIEDKTNANDYLRNIGPKSVREASPFAPFPADLNYPELTFNVVMSFEVGH